MLKHGCVSIQGLITRYHRAAPSNKTKQSLPSDRRRIWGVLQPRKVREWTSCACFFFSPQGRTSTVGWVESSKVICSRLLVKLRSHHIRKRMLECRSGSFSQLQKCSFVISTLCVMNNIFFTSSGRWNLISFPFENHCAEVTDRNCLLSFRKCHPLTYFHSAFLFLIIQATWVTWNQLHKLANAS